MYVSMPFLRAKGLHLNKRAALKNVLAVSMPFLRAKGLQRHGMGSVQRDSGVVSMPFLRAKGLQLAG